MAQAVTKPASRHHNRSRRFFRERRINTGNAVQKQPPCYKAKDYDKHGKGERLQAVFFYRRTCLSEQPSQQQPHDKESQTVRYGIGDPIQGSHMGQRLPQVDNPHCAAGKAVSQPLPDMVPAHPFPYEQEQRGNQGVGENPVNRKDNRHGSVLRENAGSQNRLLASRDGKAAQ